MRKSIETCEQIAHVDNTKNKLHCAACQLQDTASILITTLIKNADVIASFVDKALEDANKTIVECDKSLVALDNVLQAQQAAEAVADADADADAAEAEDTDAANADADMNMERARALCKRADIVFVVLQEATRRMEIAAATATDASTDRSLVAWFESTVTSIRTAIKARNAIDVLFHTYFCKEDLSAAFLVHFAVKQKASDNVIRAYGMSPPMQALLDVEIVQELLAIPSVVNTACARDSCGHTALFYAIRASCSSSIKKLLNVGSVRDTLANQDEAKELLTLAITHADTDTVRELLKIPAVVAIADAHHAQNSNDETFLEFAIFHDYRDTVKELLAVLTRDAVEATLCAYQMRSATRSTLLMNVVFKFFPWENKLIDIMTILLACPAIVDTVNDVRGVANATVLDFIVTLQSSYGIANTMSNMLRKVGAKLYSELELKHVH